LPEIYIDLSKAFDKVNQHAVFNRTDEKKYTSWNNRNNWKSVLRLHCLYQMGKLSITETVACMRAWTVLSR